MKVSIVLGLTTLLAASANAYDTLKSRAGNLRIGVAANTSHFNKAGYTEALSNFNYMVAENGCKLSGIQQQKGVYNYNDCDAHYNKAKQLGMAFRGHCLIWHSYQPSWFENAGSGLRSAIVDHITNVLKHYEGKIDTWDVVNEAIDDSSNGNGWVMRKSFLYNNVPDFVDLAFKTARSVSPNTKLFYNDYNTEGIYQKSESVYQFVKDMKTRGIPIDGVGIQYHVSAQTHPTYAKINDLIGRYCKLGLEVHITELDVKLDGSEAAQTEVYTTALKACMANSCCTGFLVWGVGDNDSWLGANQKALLFDGNYQPKAVYTALLNTLGSSSSSSPVQTTKTVPSVQTTKTLPNVQTTKTLPNTASTKTLPNTSQTNTGSAGGNCSNMWGQCGGIGYNGPTCCKQGNCKKFNDYYSQCQ